MKSQQVNKWVVDNRYILMILSVALVLRTWGADFGLPDFVFHTDENFSLSKAIKFFDPVNRPGEAVTIFHLWAWLLYKLLSIIKAIYTWDVNNKLTTPDFLLVARLIQGFLSTGSVYLVYLIGKKLFSVRAGLIAAVFLTFTYVDVQTAHYFRQDQYYQFFGLLIMCLYLWNKSKVWLWVFLLGIVASVRIIGGIYLIPMMIDVWFWDRSNLVNKVGKYLLYGILFFIGLVVGHPETYLSGKLLKYIEIYANFYAQNTIRDVISYSSKNLPNYMWWPKYLFSTGLSFPYFILVFFGFIFSLIRIRKYYRIYSYYYYLILTFFVYFGYLFYISIRVDRYILPMTPIFSLIGGFIFISIFKYIKKHQFVWCIVILLLIFPVVRSFVFVYSIGLKDTREMALEWLLENYDRKQVIVTTGSINVVGQNLQKRGYVRVKNFFDVNNYEQLQQFPEALYMISSRTFRVWENYQNVDSVKDNWNSYKEIKSQYRLVKKFEPSVVSGSFFSPYNLEHSSTVNAYHNPVVEIYEIIN